MSGISKSSAGYLAAIGVVVVATAVLLPFTSDESVWTARPYVGYIEAHVYPAPSNNPLPDPSSSKYDAAFSGAPTGVRVMAVIAATRFEDVGMFSIVLFPALLPSWFLL